MVEAVLFDIDGTLVDSVDLHAQAWHEAFRRFGREFPVEEIRSKIGKGGDELKPDFLSKEEIDEFGEDLDEFRSELFEREYLPKVKAFPQVRALFERLLADGKRIALASSAEKDLLKKLKEIAGIEDLIEEETSSDDAERSKPHPDIFHAAMDRLGDVKPESVLVIGDTPYDAEAAGKAGLRTIGVLCGGFPADDLTRAGCIALYRDPADLLAQYDSSPLAG